MFDEQLGYASIQGVEAFDQPGLNGPFAVQPLLELTVCFLIAQPIALLSPDLG